MSSDAANTQHSLPHTHPRSPRAMATLVRCAIACLALVTAVGLQAPAVSVGVRWVPRPRFRAPVIPIEPLEMTGALQPSHTGDSRPSWATWTLVALVAFVLLFFVVRWIVRRTRRAPLVNVVRIGAESGVMTEANAQILQSGLAAAMQILSADGANRDLGNAVVQAWQGLEDAASVAGLHRRPSETATEFTARILYRSRGSAAPIAVLLSLYQRVRFGEHYPRADEIAAARHALELLVALWQADFPKRRTATVVR